MSKVYLRKLTLAGLLVAVALVLSPVSVPFGPTKCFPFQHSVNAVAGVLLGPWWAGAMALVASLLRIAMGTGSVFAIPGSIPGAMIVGFAWQFVKKDWAALTEPLGTGIIGAGISSWIVAPMIGKGIGFYGLMTAFLASSVPGAIVGFVMLLILRRMKLV